MAKAKVEEVKEEKKSKTQLALDKLNKDFGAGTAMKMGDAPEGYWKTNVISTGSLKLDMATGIGGVPLGRIIEIFGWESSGKSTLLEHIIAECQKSGKKAGLIDAEHAFDATYAAAIGVDIDELIISQPDYGEQGLDVAIALIETGEFGVVGIDSIAALTPKKEIEGEMGDSSMGLQSRMMGQAMRKLAAIADKNKVLVVFINQLRQKIGVIFGSPETTSGGNALRFYASMRIDTRKSLDIANEQNKTVFKIVKNKLAPPFNVARVGVLWGVGFDKMGEVIDLAAEMGIITKDGKWYKVGETKMDGLAALRQMIEDNPEFYQTVKDQVLQKIKDGYKSPREVPKEKESE